MPDTPSTPIIVKIMLQRIMPMLIQNNRRLGSVPSASPKAVPSGAPVSRGADNPKPIIP